MSNDPRRDLTDSDGLDGCVGILVGLAISLGICGAVMALVVITLAALL